MAYTEISGDYGTDEHYHLLLNCGYRNINVTDIKMGELLLCSNKDKKTNGKLAIDGSYLKLFDSKLEVEIQEGANPDRADGEVSLYPQKVSEQSEQTEIMNAEKNTLPIVRYSSRNPMKVQVQVEFPSLADYYVADEDENHKEGEPKDAIVNLKLELSTDGGNTWTPFNSNGFGTLGSEITYSNGIATFKMHKTQNMRFVAERVFSYSEVFDSNGNCKFADNIVQIRVTRTNKRETANNCQDAVYLTKIRTWCYDEEQSTSSKTLVPLTPMDKKRRNITTRLAIKISSDTSLNKIISEINCIESSKGFIWDRATQEWDFSKRVETANPSALVLYVLTHEMLGVNAFNIEKIDTLQLGKLYEYCEDEGFTCNGILTQRKKMREIVSLILGTCNSFLVRNGNKYSFFIDKKKEGNDRIPVTIINNHNILKSGLTNEKEFKELPDGYKIKFIDDTNGYQETERVINLSGRPESDNNYVMETLSFVWVTDPRQVYKLGRFDYNKRVTRPENWIRPLGFDGNLMNIGDLVTLQDDTLSVGIGDGGEVVAVTSNGGTVTQFITDTSLEVTDSTSAYGVKVSHYEDDGTHSVKVYRLTFDGVGIFNKFTLANTVLEGEIQVGDTVAFGYYNRETTDCLVIGKQSDGNGNWNVSLVQYDESTYFTGVVPKFNANITRQKNTGGKLSKDSLTYSDLAQAQAEQKKSLLAYLQKSGIEEVITYYTQDADNKATPSGYQYPPSDRWKFDIGEVGVILGGHYLWTCFAYKYNDGHFDYAFSASRQGENGETVGTDSLELSDFVIKQVGNEYYPKEISFTRHHVDSSGAIVKKPCLVEVVVNGEYKRQYKTTEDNLDGVLTYADMLPKDERLNYLDVYMYELRETRDVQQLFIDHEKLPVIDASVDKITADLKNDFQQFLCDKGGYVGQKTIKTEGFVMQGFEELKDWDFYDLPTELARENGFEISAQGHELTITTIEGNSMPDYGALELPIFIHSEKDNGIVFGRKRDGIIIGSSANGFVLGTLIPSEFSGRYRLLFKWQKSTIDDRLVAMSVPKPQGLALSPFDFPTESNIGDYVLYVGETAGAFEKMHVYTWDGVRWSQDDNLNHKMAFLEDAVDYLDKNEPNNEYYKYYHTLFTKEIFTSFLGASHIVINGNGDIASEIKDSDGVPMFLLRASDGKAIFRNVEIKGDFASSKDIDNAISQTKTDLGNGKIPVDGACIKIGEKTLIADGYLQTDFIKANSLDINKVATGKIETSKLAIGDASTNYTTISGNSITTGSLTLDRLETTVKNCFGTDTKKGTVIEGSKIKTGSITATELDVDNITLNLLKTKTFDELTKVGFFMDGKNNVEYHFGTAFYDSDTIRTAKSTLFTSLGYNAGRKSEYRGAWSSTVSYAKMDVVYYNGHYYGAIYANVNVSPTNTSSWLSLDDATTTLNLPNTNIVPHSIAIGHNTLVNTKDFGNIGIGISVMPQLNGIDNIGIGHGVMTRHLYGSYNVGIGLGAMNRFVWGGSNVAVGAFALDSNSGQTVSEYSSSSYNVAVGRQAMDRSFKSNYNVAVGFCALNGESVTYTQSRFCVAIGAYSLADYSGENTVAINDTHIPSGRDNQIGINNRLRYVEFSATDTENDVYTYIADSFRNMTDAVVRVGCIGNRWRNELTSFTVTSTSVAFTHNGNQTCYTARKGSSEKIGYPIVLFYVNSPRGSDA